MSSKLGHFFMKKIELNKVDKRINIIDYTTNEYVDFIKRFNNRILYIKYRYQNKVYDMNIKINTSQLTHLMGFHYAYDTLSNKNRFRGKNSLNTLCKIDFGQIRKNIKKNKPYINGKLISWEKDILPRIEYLPMALNTLEKRYKLKKRNDNNILVKTKLKGHYFYYKITNENVYLIFSIIPISKSYTFESFIVNDGIRLLGPLDDLDIIDISFK